MEVERSSRSSHPSFTYVSSVQSPQDRCLPRPSHRRDGIRAARLGYRYILHSADAALTFLTRSARPDPARMPAESAELALALAPRLVDSRLPTSLLSSTDLGMADGPMMARSARLRGQVVNVLPHRSQSTARSRPTESPPSRRRTYGVPPPKRQKTDEKRPYSSPLPRYSIHSRAVTLHRSCLPFCEKPTLH